MKRAKLISFYDTLHIDVLYEWAADFEDFEDTSLAMLEEDREDITAWLIDRECPPPTSIEEAEANWRNRSDDVGPDDPAPKRRDRQPSDFAASSSSSSSAAAAAASSASSVLARKPFVVSTRALADDLDPTATPTSCSHCGMERTVAGAGSIFPCGSCFHVSGKLISSAINTNQSVALRAQAANFKMQAASSAAAAASSSTSSGGKEDNTTS